MSGEECHYFVRYGTPFTFSLKRDHDYVVHHMSAMQQHVYAFHAPTLFRAASSAILPVPVMID